MSRLGMRRESSLPARSLLLIVAAAVVLGAATTALALGKTETGLPSTVLMLPINPIKPPEGKEIIPGGAGLGDQIGKELKEFLTVSGRVTVTTLHPDSPMVKRAGGMDTLMKSPPGETDIQRVERARQIGAKLGVDAVILGSVSDYVYDGEAPSISITVQIYVVEKLTSTEPVPVTGITGSSPPVKPSKLITEELLRQAAIRDVALKTASGILGINPDDLAKWAQLKGPRRGGKKLFGIF